MAQQAPWDLFIKCFCNQATQEEKKEINDWLEEDIENLKTLEEVYNIYSISSVLPSPMTPDTNKAWQKVNRKISWKKIRINSLVYHSKHMLLIAAMVVFCLMIAGIINSQIRRHQEDLQFTEIVTQPGQKTSVTLPDGSRVWLNSSSVLKYPVSFNKKEREVSLSGEAFFEVHKDKSKLFCVKTGRLWVGVHGTSFNIQCYPDDDSQKVTVAEGIVGISDRSKEVGRLTKGEQAVLNEMTGKIIFRKENPDLVSAWKNNELVFRNMPVEEVVKALESWYGVKITIDNKMLDGHNYTFKIKTETFREVMDMMKVMTPFSYKIDGKDVEIKYNN